MHGRNSCHILHILVLDDLSFLFEAERYSSNMLNLSGCGARVNTTPPGEAGFCVGTHCAPGGNTLEGPGTHCKYDVAHPPEG